MDIGKKCISMIIIVCYSFMFTGCYTTKTIYEDIEVTLTLEEVIITSHQNNMGVLYYTVDGMYHNSYSGLLEVIGDDFPFSIYSDALMYKNEHADDFEKVIVTTQKQLVKKEREFSPGRTALSIGLPILGALTILGIFFLVGMFEEQPQP